MDWTPSIDAAVRIWAMVRRAVTVSPTTLVIGSPRSRRSCGLAVWMRTAKTESPSRVADGSIEGVRSVSPVRKRRRAGPSRCRCAEVRESTGSDPSGDEFAIVSGEGLVDPAVRPSAPPPQPESTNRIRTQNATNDESTRAGELSGRGRPAEGGSGRSEDTGIGTTSEKVVAGAGGTRPGSQGGLPLRPRRRLREGGPTAGLDGSETRRRPRRRFDRDPLWRHSAGSGGSIPPRRIPGEAGDAPGPAGTADSVHPNDPQERPACQGTALRRGGRRAPASGHRPGGPHPVEAYRVRFRSRSVPARTPVQASRTASKSVTVRSDVKATASLSHSTGDPMT